MAFEDPSQSTGQQPDEDLLAMIGLHPAQMAVAHGLASGAIHPKTVIDAVTPKPDVAPTTPSTPNLIAAPDASGVTPIMPPSAGTADLEARAARPKPMIATSVAP